MPNRRKKPMKTSNKEKTDPPGTPTKDVSKQGSKGRKNADGAVSKTNRKEEDECFDSLEEDEEIRKMMEEEGCGNMSVKEWLDSWRPELKKTKRRKVSVSPTERNVELVEKGLSNTGVDAEESSADDSKDHENDIPINVETNVEAEGRERGVLSPSSSSYGASVDSRAAKAQIDFWRFKYQQKIEELKGLKTENQVLKRKAGRRKCDGKPVLEAADRQLLDEAKHAMREVGRHVKFQREGWLSYSRQKGTVCYMVMSKISFPPGLSESEMMKKWYNVLVPHLPGVLQELKNKMTQKFRVQHESKTRFV